MTIAHPGLGEEDEEFLVVDHSLTPDGVIEEYYVDYKDELISVPADEAKIIVAEGHGDEEELNSIREAYGLPKKRKGPHGARSKLNCRSVHSL